MFDLTGTVAVVTGAARGIGRACAVRLAQAGARVIVHYHTSEADARATLDALGDRGLGTISADLAGMERAGRFAGAVIERWPDVNALVNNAGIYLTQPFVGADFDEMREHWRRVFDVNVMAAVALSHRFARRFRERGGGKIINVASRAGFRGEAGAAAYASSKAALLTFTKSLGMELAKDGVFVYGIAPGWTDTEMVRARPAEQREAALRTIPFGRMAAPEEIGACAAFLASREADYLTGVTIDVNGASYLR